MFTAFFKVASVICWQAHCDRPSAGSSPRFQSLNTSIDSATMGAHDIMPSARRKPAPSRRGRAALRCSWQYSLDKPKVSPDSPSYIGRRYLVFPIQFGSRLLFWAGRTDKRFATAPRNVSVSPLVSGDQCNAGLLPAAVKGVANQRDGQVTALLAGETEVACGSIDPCAGEWVSFCEGKAA